MKERLTRATLVALVLGFTVRCGPGITSDEFHCEVAMARLAECCPSFPLHDMTCQSVPRGCGYALRSQITGDEASGIRERSCQELLDDGLCEVVPSLPVTDEVCDSYFCEDGSVRRDPVCP